MLPELPTPGYVSNLFVRERGERETHFFRFLQSERQPRCRNSRYPRLE